MKNITYYNAGAGSGKTYTLTHQFADLIETAKYRPAEFILTTFTIKAADEFRERTRQVLYERGLYEDAADLDQAQIGTVHSVANSFVNRYWYLLGLSPNLTVMTDNDQAYYIGQSLAGLPSADDTRFFHKFREEFNITKKGDGSFKSVANTNFWSDWLRQIIAKMVNYEIADLAPSKAKSLELIDRYLGHTGNVVIAPSDVQNLLAQIQAMFAGERPSKILKERQDALNGFLKIRKWHICDLANLGTFLKKLTGSHKKQLPAIDDMASHIDLIWGSDRVHNLVKEALDRVYALAEKWQAQYAAYKRQHQVLDFNDMERYMLELLNMPQVVDEFKGRYKILMVDEFQDSSPIQVKIFSRLSELVEHSYWCGDSKQAIYGFRGSDTALTEAVSKIVAADTANKSLTLGKSYRSLPPIVELCNKLFTRVFADTLQPEQITLEAHKKPDSTVQSLLHLQLTSKRADERMSELAEYIGNYVKNREIPYKDIAVLARQNSELSTLAAALDKLEIPYNFGEDALTEHAEVQLMRAILLYATDKRDLLARATIVWLTERGITLEELLESKITVDDPHEEWLADNKLIRRIDALRDYLAVQGVVAQVQSCYAELGLYAYLQQWGRGAKREKNVMQLIELASEYEQHCDVLTLGATVRGFLDYVESAKAVAAGDPEGVTLSTIHGAKGLEWPVVILLSLDNDPSKAANLISRNIMGVQLLATDEPSVANLYPPKFITLVPDIFGGSVPDIVSQNMQASPVFADARQTAVNEWARLMYVAMTRAKDVLITTSGPRSALQGLKVLHMPVAESFKPGRVDLFGVDVPLLVVESTGGEGDEEEMEEYVLPPVSRRLVYCMEMADNLGTYGAYFLAPSTPVAGLTCAARQLAATGHRIVLAGAPEMDRVGSCVHDIFAVPDFDAEAVSRLLDDYAMACHIPTPAQIATAWDDLAGYLTEHYGAPVAVWHELPFSHRTGDREVTGSMDLVWQTADGCVLVDYKTFPGTATAILDEHSEHYAGRYAGQFGCYAAALAGAGQRVLDALVYYPVAGLIVQLTI